MSDLEFTPPLFAILSSLIEERVGLCYVLQDQELLASKLMPRVVESGFSSLLDYYYFLRYDPSSDREFASLVNSLVVNETFFFRELGPLSVMVTELLAPLVKAGTTPRVWCAACSTGEEPLTLAMLLDQHALLGKVEIVATDVSGSALAKARSGEYGPRSLRQVPVPALAAKWLIERERGVAVRPALRDTIVWQELNLMDEKAILALGSFDLIVCRNVLIYFRDATVAKVIHQLESQLRPGGVLLVGVSESLMRFRTSLACEERSSVFFYRQVQT
jgi:chemotaxis protein methyltransferase CheR